MMLSRILTKSTQHSGKFFRHSPFSHMTAVALAACLMVTGCGRTDQTGSDMDASVEKASSEQIASEATNEALQEHQQTIAETETIADEPQGKPVSYDVQNWEVDSSKRIELDDLDQLKQMFGKITVTDENSLDYASNSAIKYRFMKGDEPYLDIIDSPSYLEFGWYYANPNDSDEEKQMSISHAKKAYQAASALMGNEGGQLVANMLARQITKNSQVGGKQVELAKCEFYSCMIILKKEN